MKIVGLLAKPTVLPAEKLVMPAAKLVELVAKLVVTLVVSAETPVGSRLEVPGQHSDDEGPEQL